MFKNNNDEEHIKSSPSLNDGNFRILLIDDEKMMHGLIKKIIGHAYSYPIDCAESAEEGLKLYNKNSYQIILCDVRLKGKMSGIDFVKLVKKKDSIVNIIMITAYGSAEIAVECMQAGAWDFISKPFTHNHLHIILDRAIQNLQLKKKARERDYFGELYQMDELTGTNNRKIFDFVLNSEIIRSQRHNDEFSLIVIDVDNFKELNQKIGNDKCDEILIDLANYLKNICRDSDFLCRLFDDEFGIILPETSKEGAQIYINRINEKLENWKTCDSIPLSVSMGVAIYPKSEKFPDALLNCANIALNHAKLSENKVVFYEETEGGG